MNEADDFLAECWMATFGEPPPIKDAELMLPLLAEFRPIDERDDPS